MKTVYRLSSVADLPTFVETIFPHLTLGTLVMLSGPLGVGKTTLVQAMAKRLGYQGHVSSPTFTIMKVYPLAQGRLLHVDAYRLENAPAFGLEDEMGADTITFLEWPEKLLALPYAPKKLLLKLSFEQGDTRLIEITDEANG